jgi:Tfp pilus assembly protein PilN
LLFYWLEYLGRASADRGNADLMAEELPKVKRQRFWCQAGAATSLSFCVPVLKQLRLDYTPKRRKIDKKFSQK